MESAESGGFVLAWDAQRRLLLVAMRPTASYSEAEADAAIALLTRWTGAAEPYRVLVDAAGARDVRLGFRVAMARFFRDQGRRARIAVHRAHRLDRVMIPVFARLAGIEVRAFPSEAEAEAWLDGRAPTRA